MGAAVAVSLALYGLKRRSAEPAKVELADGTVVTAHSGVWIREVLSETGSSAGDGIEQFDHVFDGKIILRKGSGLYDYGDGARLTKPGDKIESFAVVEGALIVVEGGRLGHWDDAKGIVHNDVLEKAGLRCKQLRLQSDDEQVQLFLTGKKSDRQYVLARLTIKSGFQILTVVPEPIAWIASVGDRIIFGLADRKTTLLFEMPEAGQQRVLAQLEPIVGLAAVGKNLYVSYKKGVFRLVGKSLTPVVSGLGGALRGSHGNLLVLDSERGRLFSLEGLQP